MCSSTSSSSLMNTPTTMHHYNSNNNSGVAVVGRMNMTTPSPIHAVRCQDINAPDNSSMNSRRNSTTSSTTLSSSNLGKSSSSKTNLTSSNGIEKQSKRKTNSKLKEFTTVFDIKKTSVSFVSRNGEEQKKTRRAQASITKEEILRVLHLSQTQACNQIGCSLSTLKRRFYELKDDMGLQRWPQFYEEIKDLPIFPQVYPMCLEFILNREDEDPITKVTTTANPPPPPSIVVSNVGGGMLDKNQKVSSPCTSSTSTCSASCSSSLNGIQTVQPMAIASPIQ
ncbi:hypothetical protein C9374_008507 [Naegleria lovaniensis]|uniref:RWP-RK domain-containing protein n=1 Tax=Naegleria lovaniensis TaxID=51637 RepID=A0AA88GJ07_NAELO|nr:uncharacterized protein C9374_008507 [Naegleria lovaniensis]KAG2378364.1 hypothetical protein C9374_008507 [Naegleria lovaniensis]